MSDIKTKRISDLTEGTTLSGFYTIGAKLIGGVWESIRVNLGFVQAAADNASAGASAANAAASSANAVAADIRTLEAAVKQSEEGRVSAENSRATAETTRATAETARQAAEVTRIEQEETRTTNETERTTAETARAAAETTRQEQEEARETASATAVKNAEDAANRSNNLSDHRDEIRDGYWWRWDEETEEWYNTGEIAKGNVMYATFEIETETGNLYMYTDEEYTGPEFEYSESTGKLVAIV